MLSPYDAGVVLSLTSFGIKVAASRWGRELAAMPLERALPHYDRLSRQVHGVPISPNAVSHEAVQQKLRSLQRVPDVNDAPFGSPTYRAAWGDVLRGNMRSLETGMSLPAAQATVQHGPGMSMSTAGQAPREAWDRRRSARRAVDHNEDLASALFNKEHAGIYANDAGTRRTHDYAAGSGGEPARLSFDYPASLTTPDASVEQRIPRGLFKQFARNKQINTAWNASPAERRPFVGNPTVR